MRNDKKQTKANGEHLLRGKYGEDIAADYLIKKGFRIVGRNIKIYRHEMDILAENQEYFIFVEVKTRAVPYLDQYGESPFPSTPAMAVDYQRRKRLYDAASWYLLKHPTSKQPRLDVIEVYLQKTQYTNDGKSGVLRIHHIENAFGRQ